MWQFRNLVINVYAWHKISFKNAIIKQILRDLKDNGCFL